MFNAIAHHCRNRLFEWLTSLMMLGIAVVLAISPNSIANGNFHILLATGFTAALVGPLFTLCGVTRLLALYANGVWQPWGPYCRAAGALVGAGIWGQMLFALAYNSQFTNSLSMGLPVYLFLMVGELISCYRAASDVRPTN
jgi:hypothetical protein